MIKIIPISVDKYINIFPQAIYIYIFSGVTTVLLMRVRVTDAYLMFACTSNTFKL